MKTMSEGERIRGERFVFQREMKQTQRTATKKVHIFFSLLTKKNGFLTRLGCPALKRPEVAFGPLTPSFRVLCPKMPLKELQRLYPFLNHRAGVLNACECCCLLLQVKSLSLWDY